MEKWKKPRFFVKLKIENGKTGTGVLGATGRAAHEPLGSRGLPKDPLGFPLGSNWFPCLGSSLPWVLGFPIPCVLGLIGFPSLGSLDPRVPFPRLYPITGFTGSSLPWVLRLPIPCVLGLLGFPSLGSSGSIPGAIGFPTMPINNPSVVGREMQAQASGTRAQAHTIPWWGGVGRGGVG